MLLLDCPMAAIDIKANLGGRQSKIYIQKSLSTKSIFLETTSSMMDTCKYCNSEIIVKDLHKHLWLCCERLYSSEEEVYFENINRNK